MSWQTAKLSDVCEFHNGLWKGEKGPLLNVGVIRNTNFTKDGTLDDSDIAYIDVEARKFEKRRLRFGDIILEKSGGGPKQAVGRVAFFDRNSGDYSFSNFTSAIRVRDPKALSAEYLHKFLHWQYLSGVTESMQSHSTGIRNLDGDAYKAIEIAFPRISEQHRIVALLDEAFAGIATAKANIEKSLRNAEEVFDKKLTQVFSGQHAGWRLRRLDEVCAITSALVDPRQSSYLDAIHVGAGNIESKTGKLFDLKTSREEALISGKFPFDETMVLYSKIRPYLEKVARPDFRGICSADMYPLAPIEGRVTRDFLYWLLLSRPFTDYAVKGSARAGMPKVNRDHLFQYVTQFPGMEEQERLGAELDELRAEVSQIQSLYNRKLAALDELKQSLLHQAFSGQL